VIEYTWRQFDVHASAWGAGAAVAGDAATRDAATMVSRNILVSDLRIPLSIVGLPLVVPHPANSSHGMQAFSLVA
jgi:hypothetical protein